jgi:prepilin-type N-terminal cleavage/methylation domain-containing protein
MHYNIDMIKPFGRRSGFTLIELLVVIAIIGILSSVVLSTLNTGRSKAYNARIKSQLSQARVAAEVFYQDNTNAAGVGSYNTSGNAVTDCTRGMFGVLGRASGMEKYAQYQNYPGVSAQSDIVCDAALDGTSYAMSVKLATGETVLGINYIYWCVDSKGQLKGRTTALPLTATANCDS